MAEPSIAKDAAALHHDALSSYEATAVLLQHKVEFPPDKESTSMVVDEWISEAYVQWVICSNYWRPGGIKKAAWNNVEYALLACLPLVNRELIDESGGRFNDPNTSFSQHKYSIPGLQPVPLDTLSPLPEPELHGRTPAPLRTMTPPPAPKPTTSATSLAANPSSFNILTSGSAPFNISKPPMPRFTTPLMTPSGQASTTPKTRVKPQFGTSKSVQLSNAASSSQSAQAKPVDTLKSKPPPPPAEAFQKDWSSPLHSKLAQQLRVGPPANATRSGVSTPTPSHTFAVDAANCPNIIPGRDSILQGEGSSSTLLRSCEPLFLPGTDDELEQGLGDLVEAGHVDDEVVGTDGEDGDLRGQDDDVSSSDEATSPPPTNMACRLRQEPRISFVFDDSTGDLVEPHPTIFLSRLPVPPAQSQDLRRSTRSHTSLVNSTATYLKAVQGPKPGVKKNRKEAKSKDKTLEVTVPRKRARNEDEGSQAVDKPAAKKLKSKVRPVDDVEVVRPTPVVRRRGPGPSKPPPVTLGVSGRGFGEKVPSTAEAVKHGIKSIGVLQVDKDFGEFMEVDKSYWSKAVAPFVGERYTTACDHCRRLGTQCRKLLMHMVKCVRCHYSKLPCKVDGVPALNPIEHYRPKGSDAVNTFEAAVNAIEANNAAITAITQQFLAGLNVIAHTDSIRAQTFHLRGCLAPVEEEEEANNGEGEEDKAPDDIAEGESGPSKKWKHRSG
ncbi:hypothetical protein ARMGADRAFT_1092296 [Armillaria gallica]|uniref:Zn(2)-C6 fungal-type domain-containing protein n=1 Tax=Armillaria gallica TaxID=47427 RepID=A0A2H3CUC6_ARMGA|nr:hypothetical protein ARMGADRAFT_1092296 [Armillaria gallica]